MISAQEIEKVTFSKPPIGKRGYNEDEVDAFLDAVQDSVEQYEALVEDLEKRDERQLLSSGEAQVQQAPPPPPPAPPAPPAPEPPSAQAARILEIAESTARQLTDEATADAARAIRETEAAVEKALAEARGEAQRITDTARREVTEVEQRIQTLREFEKNYRQRLDSYIDAQLSTLRSDATIDPR